MKKDELTDMVYDGSSRANKLMVQMNVPALQRYWQWLTGQKKNREFFYRQYKNLRDIAQLGIFTRSLIWDVACYRANAQKAEALFAYREGVHNYLRRAKPLPTKTFWELIIALEKLMSELLEAKINEADTTGILLKMQTKIGIMMMFPSRA